MPETPPFRRLRVAAIGFLNPAPLLYNFEHDPTKSRLTERYDVSYTSPAECADRLRSGDTDMGLVPIAALPTLPGVAAVPGCAIAALAQVRSIQLVLNAGVQLSGIRSIAADAASRSSAAYVQTLLRKFHANAAEKTTAPAHLKTMLAHHDAALLIGDHALLALEDRDRNGAFTDCTWIDVATWWRQATGTAWVAAVWAVRAPALAETGLSAQVLTDDLIASRDAGVANVDRLVDEWTPRIAVPPATIRTYLTHNIHYVLDGSCLGGIARFFTLAAETGVLPACTLPLL